MNSYVNELIEMDSESGAFVRGLKLMLLSIVVLQLHYSAMVGAAGLGRLSVRSSLGQPLLAELDLVGVTPEESASLAVFNVPVLIFVALVVSVVAEAANPETAPAAIAILVAVTAVTLPFASTVIAGTTDAEPNAPVLTPALLNLASGNVPEVILLALVVSVVAEAAKVG
jgi:hypothetical protein